MSARQAGFSLAEALVALCVTLVATSVALLLYDGARRTFRTGEGAAEQQQGARSAFERMRCDLRLAGLNFDPEGVGQGADEAIEAAFDTAVVIRGDLDGDDPSEAVDPEAILAGGAQAAVSVGNDEIVAYVLAKPDGSSPDVLRFEADVRNAPRDGMVETVEIPGSALVQGDPPYTLYRITLSNDVLAWGSGSFLVRTPVLEQVRSLRFRYRGPRGTLGAAIGGADTPEARRARGGIRAIEVEIEALTRDPDPRFADPADPFPATRSYRKLRLRGWVTPRNLGRKNLPEPGVSLQMGGWWRRHDASA